MKIRLLWQPGIWVRKAASIFVVLTDLCSSSSSSLDSIISRWWDRAFPGTYLKPLVPSGSKSSDKTEQSVWVIWSFGWWANSWDRCSPLVPGLSVALSAWGWGKAHFRSSLSESPRNDLRLLPDEASDDVSTSKLVDAEDDWSLCAAKCWGWTWGCASSCPEETPFIYNQQQTEQCDVFSSP